MKLITAILFTLFLSSCAHHHKEPDHHHHAYDKQCAYSVAHGELGVKGSDEFKIDHSGKTYYFSSADKKEDFMKKINENVNAADRNWKDRK